MQHIFVSEDLTNHMELAIDGHWTAIGITKSLDCRENHEPAHATSDYNPGSLPCSRTLTHQSPPSIAFTGHQVLQSSFLHSPPPRVPSESQASPTMTLDDPPPFLLDDDPFANLTPPAIVSTRPLQRPHLSRPSTPVLQPLGTLPTPLTVPRSPLSPPDSATSCYFGAVPTTPPRARSLGKLKPAYERPAFSSRPSLPSLDTLAQMSIGPPRKVRKGKVGAQLPFEPWENMDPEEGGMSGTELDTPSITRPASPILAHIQAQYAARHATEIISDGDFIGFDGLSREHFGFFDNLSTPSLERSSASLSRSLSFTSLESVSPLETFLGDSNHDQFGNSIETKLSAEAFDTPPVSFPLSRPSATSKGSFVVQSHKSPHDDDSDLYSLVETSDQHPMPALQSDSSAWSSSRAYSASPYFGRAANEYGNGHGNNTDRNGYPPSGNGGGWGAGGGRGDDDDDRRGRTAHKSALSGSSTSSSSSDSEDSDDDYGQPITHSKEGVSSEDDVPLAQRIPTALQAQKSIRKQFREERDRRRQARAKNAKTNGIDTQSGLSSTQEVALQAAKQQQPQIRPRTGTTPTRPFAPEELAKKLQDFQVAESSRGQQPCPPPTSDTRSHDEQSNRGRTSTAAVEDTPLQKFNRAVSAFESGSRTLRAMRSFHHSGRRSEEAQNSSSLADAAVSLARRATTRAKSRVREDAPPSLPPSAWQPPPVPTRLNPDSSTLPQPRMSSEAPRKLSKASVTASKTSVDLDRSPKPPVQSSSNIKTQQRIFIGDMQRFNVVEIENGTTADDVVNAIRNQGSLNGLPGKDDWMLYEVAQDFGMERPIRGYELLSDIQASWNKDKLVNMFVLKMTPLAPLLRRDAIPSSSPTHGSYIEWESKRGKWNKRWLRLRGHSLWLSKRDNGKDEVFLCSLSNFDAYSMTRPYKSPKPFVFAVKSTDNLSFFESTADYMHVFSCQPQDAQKWIEKILIARSYVLYQERNVLFNSKAPSGNAAGGIGASLSRAGTRKARPAQPLVTLPPPPGLQNPNDVFEPGSLLAKS